MRRSGFDDYEENCDDLHNLCGEDILDELYQQQLQQHLSLQRYTQEQLYKTEPCNNSSCSSNNSLSRSPNSACSNNNSEYQASDTFCFNTNSNFNADADLCINCDLDNKVCTNCEVEKSVCTNCAIEESVCTNCDLDNDVCTNCNLNTSVYSNRNAEFDSDCSCKNEESDSDAGAYSKRNQCIKRNTAFANRNFESSNRNISTFRFSSNRTLESLHENNENNDCGNSSISQNSLEKYSDSDLSCLNTAYRKNINEFNIQKNDARDGNYALNTRHSLCINCRSNNINATSCCNNIDDLHILASGSSQNYKVGGNDHGNVNNDCSCYNRVDHNNKTVSFLTARKCLSLTDEFMLLHTDCNRNEDINLRTRNGNNFASSAKSLDIFTNNADYTCKVDCRGSVGGFASENENCERLNPLQTSKSADCHRKGLMRKEQEESTTIFDGKDALAFKKQCNTQYPELNWENSAKSSRNLEDVYSSENSEFRLKVPCQKVACELANEGKIYLQKASSQATDIANKNAAGSITKSCTCEVALLRCNSGLSKTTASPPQATAPQIQSLESDLFSLLGSVPSENKASSNILQANLCLTKGGGRQSSLRPVSFNSSQLPTHANTVDERKCFRQSLPSSSSSGIALSSASNSNLPFPSGISYSGLQKAVNPTQFSQHNTETPSLSSESSGSFIQTHNLSAGKDYLDPLQSLVGLQTVRSPSINSISPLSDSGGFKLDVLSHNSKKNPGSSATSLKTSTANNGKTANFSQSSDVHKSSSELSKKISSSGSKLKSGNDANRRMVKSMIVANTNNEYCVVIDKS